MYSEVYTSSYANLLLFFFVFSVLVCILPQMPLLLAPHLHLDVCVHNVRHIQLFKKFSILVLSEIGQRPVGDLSISGGVCIESLCQRPVNVDPSRSILYSFFFVALPLLRDIVLVLLFPGVSEGAYVDMSLICP